MLFRSADSPYQKLADLKGKKVAHTAPSSNSGNLAPRVFFPDQGLAPETDYKPLMSGGHDKSILGVSRGDYDMAAVMREVLLSPEFWDEANRFSRFSWPVEFVVRAMKDIGWSGFSVGNALTPLSNMGQNLFDPPDVAGWDLGRLWFSTGSMLARMNFGLQLASNGQPRAIRVPMNALAPDTSDATRNRLVGEWLAGDISPTTAATLARAQNAAQMVALILGSPEFQKR